MVPGTKKLASYQGMDIQRKHNTQPGIFNNQCQQQLLTAHAPISPLVSTSMDIIGTIDQVTFFQARDFKMYLLDDILRKIDRTSRADSLELQVPLLDHKRVEPAFSLPLPLNILANGFAQHVKTKYLLERSAAQFFSEDSLSRPKMRFSTPIVQCCKDPLKKRIEKSLRDAQKQIFNWIQSNSVSRKCWAFVS